MVSRLLTPTWRYTHAQCKDFRHFGGVGVFRGSAGVPGSARELGKPRSFREAGVADHKSRSVDDKSRTDNVNARDVDNHSRTV
jgi:hypothetical protein